MLWLAVIVAESTDLMSSTHTGNWLYSIAVTIFGPLDKTEFAIFNAVLRKVGHFTGYAVLSLLLFRAFVRTSAPASSVGQNLKLFYWRCTGIALGCTFLVASLDEWHQTFLPSRTGAFHDVVLDTCGAVVIQIITLLMLRRRIAFPEHRESM